MFLKELEIIGFKSFSDKTNINFTKGINAIVGPNGSGKSNIADAIRWVFGEQSVKTLRGTKMEDIIFAGSDNKKASGFAEVTLVLDNTDRAIDMDFNDISITRRMYRSGESEYYINKTQCRLKDIVEMLMDTGMGKEGYTIIGQGRIDDVLNNKSEGRRIIFEEAAGITKYKHRKIEAEKKLEHTENNIVRLEDIINEINNQLVPLGQQAEMAKKYLKLMEELKVLEVNLIINNIDKSKVKLNGIMEKLEQLNKLKDDKEAELEKANQSNAELRAAIENIEATADDVNNNIYRLINQKEKLEGEGRLLEEKASHLNITMDKLFKDEETLKKQRDNLKEDIEKNDDILKSYNIKAQGLLQEINLKEDEYSNKFASINELENKAEEMKNKRIDLLNLISDKKSSINSLLALKSNAENRINQLSIDNELLAGQYEEKLSMLEKNKEDVKDIESNMNDLVNKKDILINEREKAAVSLKNLEEEIITTRSKKDSLISRLKLLEEMEKNYGGYNKTVKTILMKHNDIKKKISGFCGAVGEIISVESNYAVAIEVALGSSIHNIITNDEEDAKMLIEFLKRNKLGRATFLPIRSIKGKYLSESEKKFLKMPGVLGIAADMVRYDKKYEGIVKHLLGRIIIVDNMNNAIKLAKASSYHYKIVTLEGELISPGGAITGGSMNSQFSNIITRKSQITQLKKDYSLLLKEMDDLNKSINIHREKIVSYDNDINQCTEALHDLEIEINNKRNKIAVIGNDMEVIKNKMSLNNKEIEELEKDKKESDNQLVLMRQELERVNDSISILEKDSLSIQGKLKILKEQSKDFSNNITSLKIEEAQLKQKIISLKQNMEKSKLNLIEADKKLINISEEIGNIKNQLIDIDENSKENNKKIEEIITKLGEKQNELENLQKLKKEKTKHFETIEENIKLLQQDLNNIQNNLHKTDMAKVKAEMDIENLEFKLLETYELSYRKALNLRVEDINIGKTMKRCEELKEEIRSFGTINVNAVEEFEKLNNRYEFLKGQLEDLRKAKDSLIQVIDDITKYMKKQFIEEFNKINYNFNEVFVKLFGGGKAQVILTDKENVLTSNIEIIAKPPGKKLQNLMLLSGGERALTAIALLFAILKMKPAPFCVLDEIDSALDDANVDRYAAFLKEFSTQFIIITHRKGSMEVANCLYGVTMDDTGTSKLLSVMLDDKVS